MLLLLNILLMMHGKHGDFLIILKSNTLLLNWSKKNFLKYALYFKETVSSRPEVGHPVIQTLK